MTQRGSKVVGAFALDGNLDTETITSNTFQPEWPPKSGRVQEFPEVDRAGWFSIDEARCKLVPAQVEFLDRLLEHLSATDPTVGSGEG